MQGVKDGAPARDPEEEKVQPGGDGGVDKPQQQDGGAREICRDLNVNTRAGSGPPVT